MKIIGIDNYNRETVSDVLIAENVNEYLSKKIVGFLNKDADDTYYKLVEDSYKIYDASEIY